MSDVSTTSLDLFRRIRRIRRMPGDGVTYWTCFYSTASVKLACCERFACGEEERSPRWGGDGVRNCEPPAREPAGGWAEAVEEALEEVDGDEDGDDGGDDGWMVFFLDLPLPLAGFSSTWDILGAAFLTFFGGMMSARWRNGEWRYVEIGAVFILETCVRHVTVWRTLSTLGIRYSYVTHTLGMRWERQAYVGHTL